MVDIKDAELTTLRMTFTNTIPQRQSVTIDNNDVV